MKKNFAILFILFSTNCMAQNVGIGTTTPTDQLHTTGTVRLQKYTGATTRLLQIDSSGRLVATSAGAVFSNNTAQAINDNGCATGAGISSSITISGQPNIPVQSSRIAVKVNITHPFAGDLKIYLIPPSINVLTLANGNGGSGDDFTNTLFTDQALSSISAGIAPFTGQYKPIGGVAGCNIPNTAVSNFSSIGFGAILPNGTWTLKVFDAAGGDVGVLNDWSISFTGPESITTAEENNFIPKLVDGNFTASNIYQPSGSTNIGIGTTNPSYILDVNGRMRLRGTGPFASAGIWHNKADNTEAAFIGMVNDSTYGFYGNSNWRVGFDVKNAQMGIGTTDPSAPLSFASAVGNKIALWGDATGGHYGLGIQGSLMQLYSSASNADIAFGYGSSSAFTENMRIKGNGNVGIGSPNPNSKLEVIANNTSQTGYFQQNGTGAALSAFSINGTGLNATSNSASFPALNASGLGGGPAIVANGQIKIADGTQGNGKVLTSDAAGNASWQKAPYGNSERFQFSIASAFGNPNALTTVYNFGTATTTYNLGQDQISINIMKSGLYHFEINTNQTLTGDYSITSAAPTLQFIYYGLTGNILKGFTPFSLFGPNSSYSSYDKSYEVFVNAPATFYVSSFKRTPNFEYKLIITGHLIAD